MEQFQAVRVNGAILPSQTDQNVILIGKVTETGPEYSTLQASDGAPIRVKMSAGNAYNSAYVEVVGHVYPDEAGGLYVDEFISRDLGDNFNLENYNEVVEMANGRFAHLFRDVPAAAAAAGPQQ
ncbi:replication factor A protein 3 [Tribonema minus]|uniref:Replication factor A protein 3 n=1 Tax=Tribonema minus TaxID=303371 RepID=A0A836C7T7_9STRA|nr:replication factor A protein 3 [Tribonema minus]